MNELPSSVVYLGRHVFHRFPGFSYEHLRVEGRDVFRVFERRMTTVYSWDTILIEEVPSLAQAIAIARQTSESR